MIQGDLASLLCFCLTSQAHSRDERVPGREGSSFGFVWEAGKAGLSQA